MVNKYLKLNNSSRVSKLYLKTNKCSSISGPSSLGLWMSLPSSAACTSRLTGALWLTAVYHSWGITYVYTFLSSLFLISTILVIVNFKRIKPMDRTKSIESQDQINVIASTYYFNFTVIVVNFKCIKPMYRIKWIN